MIPLDTDHLTVLRHQHHSQHRALVSRLRTALDPQIGATVISLEEQMRGWLAEIARRRKIHDLIPVYRRLTELVDFYQNWDTAAFDDAAADVFQMLKRQKVRIGTQDLKIASIALANDALLLSANLVHFQKVPGLKVEDWLYTPPS
jgi:tRNA(fMet)-specific endonuclease VapC